MRLSSLCYVQSFDPAVLSNRSRSLHYTADHLAHALFTTGRAPGDQTAHGFTSVFEWLHRVSIIPAYLRGGPTGDVTKSQLAQELDRSEKVGLSYSLGQAMTFIFCESCLSVPYLMHHDRYARHYNLAYAAGNTRPDLIGEGPSGWIVAEAKGRSNAMESALYAKLQTQKRSVRSINGTPPWVALGCVTSFPAPRRRLQINAFDPAETSQEAIDLELPYDNFLLAYYAPFIAALDFGEPIPGNDRYEVVQFQGTGVRLGLLRPIANAVRAQQERIVSRSQSSGPFRRSTEFPQVEGLAAAIEAARSAGDETSMTTFGDGSAFRTTWDDMLSLGEEGPLF